jgi:hypothetical protein
MKAKHIRKIWVKTKTQEEVARLLGNMKGKHALMAKLLYGCGLRLTAGVTRTN